MALTGQVRIGGDYESLVFGGAANLLGKEGVKRNIIYIYKKWVLFTFLKMICGPLRNGPAKPQSCVPRSR